MLTAVLLASVVVAAGLPLLICAVQTHVPEFFWWRSRIGVGPLSANKQAWVWGVSDRFGQSELLGQIVNERMAKAYDIPQPPDIAAKRTPRGPAPSWSIVSRMPTPPHVVVTQEERFPSFEEQAYGWPARSLSYRKESFEERLVRVPGATGKVEAEFEMTFDGAFYAEVIPPRLFYHSNQWPTDIIWRGMILNVLFFAAVFSCPWWMGSLVRWRRARAGRCVRCGYSIAGLSSEKCPECGWEVAVRATRSS